MIILRLFLLPFTFFYGFAVWVRNKLFDFGLLPRHEFSVPTIVVGNITVGGTGKTPHVEYLIRMLKESHKVAVLSRGYKRKKKGFQIASAESTSLDIGDEPRQIKQKFPDVTMAVDGNRVNGIKKLTSGAAGVDPDVIVLDDAFQHRYVKAGVSILLVDFNKPLEKDFLLPYGRLREGIHQKKRANIVIVTKTPKDLKPIDRRIIYKEMHLFPYQDLFFTYLKYGNLIQLFKNIPSLTLEKCKSDEYSVLLVTGIANPVPLKEYLTDYFSTMEHVRFPDHKSYTTRDLKKISKSFSALPGKNKVVITTEKDSVRLVARRDVLGDLPIYYIPIEVDFLDNDKEKFHKRIFSYVCNNRKPSLLNQTK